MTPARRPGVLARPLPSGETALLGPDGARLILLNELGAVVWELCDGRRDVGTIAAIIGERFAEVPRRQIERDVRALADSLAELGLVSGS